MRAEMSPDLQRQITPETKTFAPLIGEKTAPSEKHEEHNEDKTFIDQGKQMAGLFDGMGGGLGGEQASTLARDIVQSELSKVREDANAAEWQQAIRRALETAQTEVTKLGNELFFGTFEDPFEAALYRDLPQAEIQKLIVERGMSPTGTTASIAKMIERPEGGADLVYGHTGDSRIYVLRKNGTLEQVSHDQGGLEETLEAGYITKEEADFIDQATSADDLIKKFGKDRGKKLADHFTTFRKGVKKALGIAGNEFQIGTVHLEPGDLAIVTSDGIHDNLTYEEIRQEIMKGGTPAEISERLVEAAKRRYAEGVLRSKPDDKTAVSMRAPEAAEKISDTEITLEPEEAIEEISDVEIIGEEEPEEIMELGAEDIEELEAEDKRKSDKKIKEIRKAIGL